MQGVFNLVLVIGTLPSELAGSTVSPVRVGPAGR